MESFYSYWTTDREISEYDSETANILSSSAVIRHENRQEKKLHTALLVGIGSLIFVVFALFSNCLRNSYPSKPMLSQFLESNKITQSSLSIQNEYTIRDGNSGQEYPWLQGKFLAEPFKESTLVFDSPMENHEYEWKIYLPDKQIETVLSGATASYTFESLEDRKIVFTDYTISSSSQRNVFDRILLDVKVRYVRREIRALTDSDLEELLDAMAVLWNVEQDEGVQMYGKHYRSATEMLKFHLRFAGDESCDHIHDGYGFVSQHSALTLVFEQSIQAVNKRVSLPYWDYTYDVEDYIQNHMGDFSNFINSELFTAKYFGATDISTNRIKDGRWANLKVPSVSVLSNLEREIMPVNAYGQLRAPWSNNQDPHVVRYGTECGADPAQHYDMPTCEALYNLLSINDFQKYMEDISYAPHGPIHIQTGGTSGCESAYDTLLEYIDTDALNTIKALSFAFHKGAFRAGFVNCQAADGSCYCPDEDSIKNDEKKRGTFLDMAGFRSYRKYNKEFNQAMVGVICNSGLVEGDNLQASSSYTPEFWPIHGSVERMYQLKRLADDFDGGDGAITWGSASWIPLYCPGHLEDDKVLMSTATIRVQEIDIIPTNLEFMQLLSPFEENGLPYIYDNLKWDYCAEVGYDMSF